MKLSAIAIAIIFAGTVGVASAAGQGKVMQPITIAGAPVAECAPPNDHTGHRCDAFNQMLRANFTPREIGMLFGYQTSYPESLTGGIDQLQRRYQTVLRAYMAAQQSASKTNIAGK